MWTVHIEAIPKNLQILAELHCTLPKPFSPTTRSLMLALNTKVVACSWYSWDREDDMNVCIDSEHIAPILLLESMEARILYLYEVKQLSSTHVIWLDYKSGMLDTWL